jgi:hypothetical protein
MRRFIMDLEALSKLYRETDIANNEIKPGIHKAVITNVKFQEDASRVDWDIAVKIDQDAEKEIRIFNNVNEKSLVFLKQNFLALGLRDDLSAILKSLPGSLIGREVLLDAKESKTINKRTGKPFINKRFLTGSISQHDLSSIPSDQINEAPIALF